MIVEDFTLPTTDGDFSLSAACAAGKMVALFFYPKDDTPGCTIEGKEFSDLLDDFTAAGVIALGVSRDSIRSHEKFRDKFGYRHHLLTDADAALCNAFGVLKDKTMYDKPVKSISRGTFLIDENRKVVAEWRDIKEVNGHAAAVLAKAREIKGL